MNSKITLPRLVSILSDKSGLPRKTCDEFMREFASLVASSLEKGESVKVRGLGSFRLGSVQTRKSVDVSTGEEIEIAGHTKVNFTPSRELAAAVNAPFEGFESVILPDDISETDLAMAGSTSLDDANLIDATDSEILQNQDISDDIPGREDGYPTALTADSRDEVSSTPDADTSSAGQHMTPMDTPDEPVSSSSSIVPEEMPDDIPADDVVENVRNDSSVEGARSQNPDNIHDTADETSDNRHDTETPAGSKRPNFACGFLIGFACCAMVGLAVWWFISSRTSSSAPEVVEKSDLPGKDRNMSDDVIPIPAVTESDSLPGSPDAELAAAVATLPSDATAERSIIDTISRTRYLTTMAKEHYGNFNLWPYIYMENNAKLGHPDRIRPGTPVVVPPLSKYNVDPKNPKEIEKAKKLGLEIYAKYR